MPTCKLLPQLERRRGRDSHGRTPNCAPAHPLQSRTNPLCAQLSPKPAVRMEIHPALKPNTAKTPHTPAGLETPAAASLTQQALRARQGPYDLDVRNHAEKHNREDNNRVGLTRTGARVAHGQSRLVQLPPSLFRAGMRACVDRSMRSMGGSGISHMGGNRIQRMKVLSVSGWYPPCAATLPGPPPGELSTSLPGPDLPGSSVTNTVLGQHPLVRPGS